MIRSMLTRMPAWTLVLALLLTLLLALLGGPATAQDDTQDDTETATGALPTIAQLVAEHPELSELYALMADTGVLDSFDGGGQFTLFAPIDAAFAALEPSEREELAAGGGAFDNVFRFHVVEGAASAQALAGAPLTTTLQGDELTLEVEDGVLLIGGARLLEADLRASNGVVHVIDAVLLPSNRFPRKDQSTIPAGEESGDDAEPSGTGEE